MSDIQRYNISDLMFYRETRPTKFVGVYLVLEKDHLKAIEAKDKEIENLKGQYKTLDIGFDKSLQINATQTKEIESLKAEVERLTHFSHFMCETWSAIQQWSIEHFDENNLGSFPMVQGTANQNRLRDIGEKPYKKELINQAVMELIK